MSSQRYQVKIVDANYYREVISCQNACPVHTDAQGYVNAVTGGDYEEGESVVDKGTIVQRSGFDESQVTKV